MEDTNKQDQDFVYVLRQLKSGIRSSFDACLRLIRFSFQNFVKVGAVIVLFVALGLGLYYSKSAYYTSSMTVSHVRVNNDYCKELVNSLGTLIDGKTNAELATQLQISEESAAQIGKIEYADLNEALAKRFLDSNNVILPFKVCIDVFEKSILDTLQIHVINYLESNVMAKRLKDIDITVMQSMEQRYSRELRQVDSLKTKVAESLIPRGTGAGLIYGEPVDPVGIYRSSLELFDRKMQLEKKIALSNSFELAVPFNKSAKRADSGLLFYLVTFFGIGYMFALIFLYKKS